MTLEFDSHGFAVNCYLRIALKETPFVRVKIDPNSITAEDLQTQLAAQFPSWKFKKKGSKGIFAANDKNVGVYIKVRKRAIILESRFAKTGHQVAFVISLIAAGVIVPGTIYLIIFGKRMKKMRVDVSEAVSSSLNGPTPAQ